MRYRVELPGDAAVYVRTQNLGTRFDTAFQSGDPVQVQWQVENAQILTE